MEILLADHILNVDEVLYWLGAILTIFAVVTAIYVPVKKMLKKYDKALQKTEKTLENHADINAQYQKLIDESKADRKQLNEDVSAIKKATLTQIKLELTSICDNMINRGYAYLCECEKAEHLFDAYEPLGGNSGMAAKVERVRALPVRRAPLENKEIEE